MTRPKGWAHWHPKQETLAVVAAVIEILREYEEYLPMTNRQIFYALVGRYDYEKTEKAYKRLCEYLVRARRAGMIPFKSIRDDGVTQMGGDDWASEANFWDNVKRWGEEYQRDRQQNQPVRIELWCEAAGMAPMLKNAVEEWSVPVYSTGGFSSVTVTRKIAARCTKDHQRPTVFLHVGDYDPSGESIFESMSEDVLAFVEAEGSEFAYASPPHFQPVRVALTEEQVNEFNLPTAPPKMSDSRSAKWVGETTQAEAMPPDLLVTTVRNAVEGYIDEDILAETIEKESADRERIIQKIEDAFPDDEDES